MHYKCRTDVVDLVEALPRKAEIMSTSSLSNQLYLILIKVEIWIIIIFHWSQSRNTVATTPNYLICVFVIFWHACNSWQVSPRSENKQLVRRDRIFRERRDLCFDISCFCTTFRWSFTRQTAQFSQWLAQPNTFSDFLLRFLFTK